MITAFKQMNFAHIDCKSSILVKGYPDDESITIGCFGYFIEKDGKKIVVDTGIEDIDIVNMTKSSADEWQRNENEFSMQQNLENIGVVADEVDEVYITHSHYDHISSLHMFKNAKVFMSETEYEYLVCGENPHRKFLDKTVEYLNFKKNQGDLILIKEDFEDGDTHCKVVGGHTPGSMLVYIEDMLFTGDAIFLLDSINKNQPIGFCSQPDRALYALELCSSHKGCGSYGS